MSERDWEVEPYAPPRRAEVVSLMGAVQGHPTSEEEFAWEFERNPVGDLNVLLAIHAGEVVGISCHNTFRMRLGADEAVVSFPLNVLTREDFRGRGIFTTLERANEEHAARIGAPLMLSFPNAASTPIFLDRLGWTRLEAPRLLLRPLLPAVAGRARLAQGLRLELTDRFGDWANASWVARDEHPAREFVRDADYLNWRFVDRPGGRYRLQVLRREDEAVGFAVDGETVKRGRRLHFVAAMALAPGYESAAPALRSAVARGARARATLDLEQPSQSVAALLRHGYVRVPKRLNMIAKALDSTYGGDWLTRGPWAFRLGDLDFF
jgi:GNAT superfamily N-acetyltransferase